MIDFVKIAFYEEYEIKEIMQKVLLQFHTGQQVYRIHNNKLPE